MLAGSVRDFTLNRLLAVRHSEQEADQEGEAGGQPRAATRELPTDWIAPNLPI
jgi:hypothetical protein